MNIHGKLVLLGALLLILLFILPSVACDWTTDYDKAVKACQDACYTKYDTGTWELQECLGDCINPY